MLFRSGTAAQMGGRETVPLRLFRHTHPGGAVRQTPPNSFRSEERRVGKECRSRWSPYH